MSTVTARPVSAPRWMLRTGWLLSFVLAAILMVEFPLTPTARGYLGGAVASFWQVEIFQEAEAPLAIRDGNLITGQQNFSGAATAELLVQTLGRSGPPRSKR